MNEPLFPTPSSPTADLPADKGSAWDAIIDTVLDDESGELQLVVDESKLPAQDKPVAEPEPAPVGEGAVAAPEPPLDKSAQELRAWATRLSQENAVVRKELQELKGRSELADATQGSEEFIDRLAKALPEDFTAAVTDRASFARIVTKVAERIAANATTSLSEQVKALQAGITSMGRAVEFTAVASPEIQALVPRVREIAEVYQSAYGKNVFDDYSVVDVLQVARAYRDQSQQNQEPATPAPGHGPSAPPPAAPPVSAARPPVTSAQRAASASGVNVNGDDVRQIGRIPETGPRSFGVNVRSIIDDVVGEVAGGGS